MNKANIVAHILDIPVQFRFDVEVAEWTTGMARPVGWLGGVQGQELLLELLEPFQYRGVRQQVSPQFLPKAFASELRTCAQMHDSKRGFDPMGLVAYGGPYVPAWDPACDSAAARYIRSEFGNRDVQLLVCQQPKSDLEKPLRQIVLVDFETQKQTPLGEELQFGTHKVEPWALRWEFLRLRRTTDELLRFLNRSGQWSKETRPSRIFATNSCRGKEHDIAFVLPDSIWADQDTFAQALKSTPQDWLARSPVANLHQAKHFLTTFAKYQPAVRPSEQQ